MGGMSLDLSFSLTGGGSAFDPLTLPWSVYYEPSASTLFQTDGTTPAVADGGVGKMSDMSGNAKHMLQTTGAKQPLYKTAGGLHWVDFDGTDDWLRAGSFTAIVQPFTLVAAVLIENAAGSGGSVFDGFANRALMGCWTSNDYRMFAGSNLFAGTRNASAHVMMGYFNGASSTLKVDEVQIGSGDVGGNSLGSQSLYLGVENSEAGGFFNGRFYGGGIIPRALTASEEAALNDHLAARAGI